MHGYPDFLDISLSLWGKKCVLTNFYLCVYVQCSPLSTVNIKLGNQLCHCIHVPHREQKNMVTSCKLILALSRLYG